MLARSPQIKMMRFFLGVCVCVQHSIVVSMLASRPSCPWFSFPAFPKLFSEEKIVDAAEVNQPYCLDECGRWFENVDQTQLQKKMLSFQNDASLSIHSGLSSERHRDRMGQLFLRWIVDTLL